MPSESVAFWLRSPKIEKEATGDIVEVWGLASRPDLDPVKTLRAYVDRRTKIFGLAEEMPLFLHSDGTIYSKVELNQDLAKLLSFYPELNSPKDQWSGHSFRAGLSTVLSVLGFGEQDIKAWGRWKSNAFQRYIKDIAHRRAVKAKLITTFDRILSFV